MQITNTSIAQRGGPAPDRAGESPDDIGLPLGLTLLLASSAGAAVATLYYAQPMLGILAADTGASTDRVGLVTTLTQVGYAIGICLLAPLGDRYDRRTIILGKTLLLFAALVTAAMAPGLGTMLGASLVIGLAATLAQDVVPAAAAMAPAAHRGRVVGTVMTGLLLGILLSRVIAGLVGEHFGWRAMFGAAAVSVALFGAASWVRLPSFAPSTGLPYGRLLASLGSLWQRYPALRRAAVAQGLLSVGFSAFWTTMAVMLHGAPYHLGSAAAGAFGLAGAAGALAAPVAGRLADRRGPGVVTRLGSGLAAAFFALLFIGPWLPTPWALALLAIAAVGFDLGVQTALIAHQTIIYGLEPDARSRLNAVLITVMFVGMALGSGLGTLLMGYLGWWGVVSLATLSAAGALLVRCWPMPRADQSVG